MGFEEMTKYLLIAATALGALAQPAFAQGMKYQLPSGIAEAAFPEMKADEAAGKIASVCMDRSWVVASQTSNQVVCEFKLSVVDSAISRVFLGNRYSTDPRGFVRFSITQIGSGSRAQAVTWIETQMAMGQMRQEYQNAPGYFDSMVEHFLLAGGELPQGSKILGRMVGIGGNVMKDGKDFGNKVAMIAPGLPGDVAGIKAGDLILKVNGKKFKTYDDFRARFQPVPSGSPSIVTIKRAGVVQDLMVSARDWPEVGTAEYKTIMQSVYGSKAPASK
jgi:hypothetical protein